MATTREVLIVRLLNSTVSEAKLFFDFSREAPGLAITGAADSPSETDIREFISYVPLS